MTKNYISKIKEANNKIEASKKNQKLLQDEGSALAKLELGRLISFVKDEIALINQNVDWQLTSNTAGSDTYFQGKNRVMNFRLTGTNLELMIHDGHNEIVRYDFIFSLDMLQKPIWHKQLEQYSTEKLAEKCAEYFSDEILKAIG